MKKTIVREVKSLRKIFGLSLVVMFAVSFAFAGSAFAGADEGKSLFGSKKCKTCHKAQGDPAVFKPVGPGLKDVGKRHSKEWLAKWLTPANKEQWESNDADVQELKARYKVAKKRDMKKSQMVKNFAPGKGGKPPKIVLTADEVNSLVDYLLTL